MAFSEFEVKRTEKILASFVTKRGPPPHLHNEVQLCFRVLDCSVEIFEKRAFYHDKSRMQELPVARAIYVKSQGIWKVYWQRADMRWHSYEPQPEVKSVEEFVAIVDVDEYCCFFG